MPPRNVAMQEWWQLVEVVMRHVGTMVLLLACAGAACLDPGAQNTAEDGGGTPVADAGADAGPPNYGDIGQACDPAAMPTTCAYKCLDKGDGTGLCVGLCGASGPLSCPSGFKCNTLPDGNDGTVDQCLPNASCGDLTYQGGCTGAVLNYCGAFGAVTLDCSTRMGDNNQPMQCAVVNPQIGANCVSSAFSPGCGMETEQGRCDGNTVVFCESVASGTVRRQDCAAGQTCAVGATGVAECRAPDAAGCGNITYQGGCEGNVVVWCSSSAVQRKDCAAEGKSCGFVDNTAGFWCTTSSTNAGANRVTGKFVFEKRPPTSSGLGAAIQAPVRQARVAVVNAADHSTITSSYTAADGRFDLHYDATGSVYVAVFTTNETTAANVAVRDCPSGDCMNGGNVYGIRSRDVVPSAMEDVGVLLVPEAGGYAGAFNIFDVMVQGLAYALENYGRSPAALTAQWKSGENTRCNTSCFSARSNSIFVLSLPTDTDEYDDPVLLHEFGHFMEASFSRSDSPGGTHDGSPTDPRLAWGEGYGTFVGCSIGGSPVYMDTRASGASVMDISNTGIHADPHSAYGMRQPLSEYTVAEALWRISSSQGTHNIFDVLGSYFPSSALVDRGVDGVDLVDFLDGWKCRAHGVPDVIRSVVNTLLGFPYDEGGPTSC